MQVVSDTRATKSLKRQRNHQKHPFPNPKNHGGGNYKKYAKGFSGGARPPLGGQAAGLGLSFFLELGSRESVKLHQSKRPGICLVFYFGADERTIGQSLFRSFD